MGLIPALTRKSVKAVLNFVYPVLKSSPMICWLLILASSITPGTKVFYGDPFIKEQPSSILATA
jgi:hypothetical protein